MLSVNLKKKSGKLTLGLTLPLNVTIGHSKLICDMCHYLN
jgi:hypothetical protein